MPAVCARLGRKVDIRQAAPTLPLAVAGLWVLGWLAQPVAAKNSSGVQDVPGDLTALSLPELSVPGYTRVDTRIGWRPNRRLGLDLVLQNLLDDRHLEFFAFDLGIQPTEVRRSLYGKMTWRF